MGSWAVGGWMKTPKRLDRDSHTHYCSQGLDSIYVETLSCSLFKENSKSAIFIRKKI